MEEKNPISFVTELAAQTRNTLEFYFRNMKLGKCACEVKFMGKKIVTGFGNNKKSSKLAASRLAIEYIRNSNLFDDYFSTSSSDSSSLSPLNELNNIAVRTHQKLEYLDLGNTSGKNVVEVQVNGDVIAHGEGSTVKKAKLDAANQALAQIKENGMNAKTKVWTSEPIPVKKTRISDNTANIDTETQTDSPNDYIPEELTAFLEVLLREVRLSENEKIAIEWVMLDCQKLQNLLPNIMQIHTVGSYVTGSQRKGRWVVDLVALISVAITPIYFEMAEILWQKAYFETVKEQENGNQIEPCRKFKLITGLIGNEENFYSTNPYLQFETEVGGTVATARLFLYSAESQISLLHARRISNFCQPEDLRDWIILAKVWANDNKLKIPVEALELAVFDTYQPNMPLGHGFRSMLQAFASWAFMPRTQIGDYTELMQKWGLAAQSEVARAAVSSLQKIYEHNYDAIFCINFS